MAITDTFSSGQRGAVTSQLGPYLAAFEPEKALPPSGVAESFQVWTVSLARFLATGTQDAAWNQVWHHQLRAANREPGAAEGFARSIQRGDSALELRSVYRSTLAGEIDLAVAGLDRDPEFASDSVRVRLLEIPDLHLMTLWINEPDGTNRYIPLGKFARSGDQLSKPMTEQELIARLQEEKPVIGISVPPAPREGPAPPSGSGPS
jgi:hypothetical protein